jgi:hypothetical protein
LELLKTNKIIERKLAFYEELKAEWIKLQQEQDTLKDERINFKKVKFSSNEPNEGDEVQDEQSQDSAKHQENEDSGSIDDMENTSGDFHNDGSKEEEFQDYIDGQGNKLCTKDFVSQLNTEIGVNEHHKFIHRMCVKVFGKAALSEQTLTGRRKNRPASPSTTLNVKHLAYIKRQAMIRLKIQNRPQEQIDSICGEKNFRQSISKVTKLYTTK